MFNVFLLQLYKNNDTNTDNTGQNTTDWGRLLTKIQTPMI